VRNAKNGGEFVQTVKSKIGIELMLYSGEQEAQLSMKASTVWIASNGHVELIEWILGGSSVEFNNWHLLKSVFIREFLRLVIKSDGNYFITMTRSFRRSQC